MAVQPNAEVAEQAADRVTDRIAIFRPEAFVNVKGDSDPALSIGERIKALHAEFVQLNVDGDNMQHRIEQMVAEVTKLDERRTAILRELRSISQPPGGDTLMTWGRR